MNEILCAHCFCNQRGILKCERKNKNTDFWPTFCRGIYGKDTAGATPYHDLKTRILDTFGTKPDNTFETAAALVMTGKPSQLLNKIINTLCPNHPNLEACCAAGTVSGLWRRQLPPEVWQRIAGMNLVGTDNIRAVCQTADAVYETLQLRGSGVAAYDPAMDTSADAPALQVAAAGRGRGGTSRRGRGATSAT